jgi:hypothetical protein
MGCTNMCLARMSTSCHILSRTLSTYNNRPAPEDCVTIASEVSGGKCRVALVKILSARSTISERSRSESVAIGTCRRSATTFERTTNLHSACTFRTSTQIELPHRTLSVHLLPPNMTSSLQTTNQNLPRRHYHNRKFWFLRPRRHRLKCPLQPPSTRPRPTNHSHMHLLSRSFLSARLGHDPLVCLVSEAAFLIPGRWHRKHLDLRSRAPSRIRYHYRATRGILFSGRVVGHTFVSTRDQ